MNFLELLVENFPFFPLFLDSLKTIIFELLFLVKFRNRCQINVEIFRTKRVFGIISNLLLQIVNAGVFLLGSLGAVEIDLILLGCRFNFILDIWRS